MIEDYLDNPILQAIEQSRDLNFFVKNLDLQYVLCSDSVSNISHTPKSELYGKTDYDFGWGEAAADLFRSDDLHVIERKTIHTSEYLLPFSGKNIWLKTYKLPILDKNRKIIGIFAHFRDITEQKVKRMSKSERLRSTNVVSTNLNHAIFNYFNYHSAKYFTLLEELSSTQSIHEKVDETLFRLKEITAYNRCISEIMLKLSNKDDLSELVNAEKLIRQHLAIYLADLRIIIKLNMAGRIKFFNYIMIMLSIFTLLGNKDPLERILISFDSDFVTVEIENTKQNKADGNNSRLFSATDILSIKPILQISQLTNLQVDIFTNEETITAFRIQVDHQDNA